MSVLPRISGRQVVAALSKAGYEKIDRKAAILSSVKRSLPTGALSSPIMVKWPREHCVQLSSKPD